jgi:hypothetical protein
LPNALLDKTNNDFSLIKTKSNMKNPLTAYIVKRTIFLIAWTASLLVFIALISCSKEEPAINQYYCVQCTKYNRPVIDTCDNIQSLNGLVLALRKEGYKCNTTEK